VCDLLVDLSTREIVTTTLNGPPWTFSLPVTGEGYEISGEIASGSDSLTHHPFDYRIEPTPPGFTLDRFCGRHNPDPTGFASQPKTIELSVTSKPINTLAKTVYFMQGTYRYWSTQSDHDREKGLQVSLTVTSGKPTEIKRALCNGVLVKSVECEPTEVRGEYKLSFECQQNDRNSVQRCGGIWKGDSFTAYLEESNPDDFQRRGKYSVDFFVRQMTLEKESSIDLLMNLPQLATICQSIVTLNAQIVDRPSYFPCTNEDAYTLLAEIGATEVQTNEIITVLSSLINKLHQIGEWTADPNTQNLLIYKKWKQNCFPNSKDSIRL